jgi:hypothetical protein
VKEYSNGIGKFGVRIVHHDGTIEKTWCTTRKARKLLFDNMKKVAKNVQFINR